MNRQSAVGFALIGLILILFSWYNTKQFAKQQEEKFRQDSIAAALALEKEAAEAALRADSDSTYIVEGTSEEMPLYQSQLLNSAVAGEEETVTLENAKVKISLSSKGAQPSEVMLKEYFKYDSTALYLMPKNSSSFDIELDAGQYINTSELNYQVVSKSDSSAVFRLMFDADSYMETIYTLSAESYTLNSNLRFVGMDNLIPRSSQQMKVSWAMDVPRLEKGYDNEKNYSSVSYKYSSNSDVKNLSLRKDSGHDELAGYTAWVAFKQQFFSAIIVAPDNFSSGSLGFKVYSSEDEAKRLMNAAAILNVDYGNKSGDFSVPLQFIFVPNHYPTLKSYGQHFDKLLPLGGWLIGSISKYVIIPLFNWMSGFISSYGLIILLMTIIIKLVISPMTLKSYSSSAKMRVLKPEIDKINAKYPKQEDALKKQQATMDLYKKCGISTFGGCLPLLLQLPILYAMFRFFPSSIELRQQGFLWADDLSAYDSILNFGFRIPLYGDHISLFALLMGVTMWGYSKMTMSSMGDSQMMPGMKFMQLWFMPIFMVCLCNNFSAGLSYYYMLSNMITIVQNWAIRKWFVDEEKLYAKLKEKANSKSAPKKSKFQQRLDEAYRIQQQQAKKK